MYFKENLIEFNYLYFSDFFFNLFNIFQAYFWVLFNSFNTINWWIHLYSVIKLRGGGSGKLYR